MNALGKCREPFFFMIDFDVERPVLIPFKDLDPKDIKIEMPIFQNSEVDVLERKKAIGKSDFFFEKEPISFENYKRKFDAVVSELKFGNSYLINLTQPTPIKTNLTLEAVFDNSSAKFKLLFKDKFVVFFTRAICGNSRKSNFRISDERHDKCPFAECA